MIHGAEHHQHQIAHLNEVSGPVFKIARDPRITWIGRILRRTSMDELPQFFNVLKGDMSLVGPRPPIPQEVTDYEPWQLRRLSVRPGITCLWQISGRSRLGFDEWMRLDMEYIERRGLSLDLKILLQTVPAVLSGKGAY
jgi:lipopolysaccharide/colanic/teichoic acid biosynthesis glycosyltransferase